MNRDGVNRIEQQDIQTFIHNYFEENKPSFQWKVEQSTPQKLVNVLVSFKKDIPADIQLQDVYGTFNQSGVLQYEDSICFFDSFTADVHEENYLKTFSFDNQEGIEEGLVEAICRQLILTFSQGTHSLDEFLKDNKEQKFQLVWNDRNLDSTIGTLKLSNRYSYKRLMIVDEQKE